MNRTAEEINHAIKKNLFDLFEVAMFDGKITEDEQAILEQITLDFEKLEAKIVEKLKSNLSEEEFQVIMNDFLKEAMINVNAVSNEDDFVTDDEKFLISTIQDFIKELGAS